MSVKVAVRVRPFNAREKQMGCPICVDMEGQTTILIDFFDKEKNRPFVFDYSFWSHDQFEINSEGLAIGTGPRYADQARVFETVGREILDNAWQGYHCCLFAYGQTGAGKSYSMVGYGPNRGIVPITCEEIFKRIQSNTDQTKQYEVKVSMFEIYNEKVQDLLVPVTERPAGGLKVREHKVYGIYVDGLTKTKVNSYSAIEAAMELGGKNRTIASTQMNASSSRAHTVIQVEFKCVTFEKGRSGEKLSVINLVDLAGSEKVGKTGASGDRLKEACQINKSLSVLGQVISVLAEKSMGKAKDKVTPYRDSQLTRILQNALGGNSKTLMICAISPADDNYEETLSTLRYADQAKKIKNKATVNESDSERMIRELKQENEMLKQQFMALQLSIQSGQFSMQNPADVSQLTELQSDMEQNANILNRITHEPDQEDEVNLGQTLVEQKQEKKESQTMPHLTNINEDPQLNGKVIYPLDGAITRIGRKTGSPVPQIILAGIGILDNHAYIENVDGSLFLVPEDQSQQFLFINGDPVTQKTQIFNNDRLILGTATTLLVRFPGLPHDELDWELCWKELSEKTDQRRQIENEKQELELAKEMQQKISTLEAENKREREEAEALMRVQKEKFEAQLRELEKQMQSQAQSNNLLKQKAEIEKQMKEKLLKIQSERSEREQEREARRRDLEDEDAMKRYRMKEKIFIEQKLKRFLPMMIEFNLIAKELQRNVKLEPKLKYVYAEQLDFEMMDLEGLSKGQVQMKVINNEEQQIYHWSLQKFENRYLLAKEVLQNYFETEKLVKLTNEQDPFWDPPEPQFIGQAFVKLEALAYLMDNPSELQLVGEKINLGILKLNLIPTDETGTRNFSQEIDDGEGPEIEDPNELLNCRLDFNVIIESAEIDENPCRDVYVEYSIQTQGKRKLQSFQTERVPGIQTNPTFNYKQQHTFIKVNDEILDYILTGTICFEVFGFEKDPQKLKQDTGVDPDLLLRKKRLTMQGEHQRRLTAKQSLGQGPKLSVAGQARRDSRQVVREKVNSFQILNPTQMRKPTLGSFKPVEQPRNVYNPQPLTQKPPVQQPIQQPVYMQQEQKNSLNKSGLASQQQQQTIKAPENKPLGVPINVKDLDRYDTQRRKQSDSKKKDKDCLIF